MRKIPEIDFLARHVASKFSYFCPESSQAAQGRARQSDFLDGTIRTVAIRTVPPKFCWDQPYFVVPRNFF